MLMYFSLIFKSVLFTINYVINVTVKVVDDNFTTV